MSSSTALASSPIRRIACSYLPLLAGLILSTTPARAATISLDFTSLPSAQGWTYFAQGNAAAEASVFSVDGTTLFQNTIGVGLAGQGSNRYNDNNVVDPVHPFILSIRARVLEEEGDVTHNSFGFSFGVFTGTETFGIGLGTSRIQDQSIAFLSTTFDNTQFHNYRLEGTPGVGYQLFIDNVFFASGLPVLSSFQNSLFLGDATGGTNARAEVTSYQFTSLPEPGTLTLSCLVAANLLIYRLRRGSRTGGRLQLLSFILACASGPTS